MSLHYLVKLEILIARVLQFIALLDRETPEFIPPQLWSPNSPDLNPVDNIVWKILQEGVQTCITDLQLSTTPLTNGCIDDEMIQLGPLRSHFDV